MSFGFLFSKNFCCPTRMNSLSLPFSLQLTLIKSSRSWGKNIIQFKRIHSHLHFSDSFSSNYFLGNSKWSRLLFTNTLVSSDSKSNKYEPRTPEFTELVPVIRVEDSKFKKFLKNLVLKKLAFSQSQSILKAIGYLYYQQLVDNVGYKDFFNAFDMPDTFNSWFIIMELHVWMLSVRLMGEGKSGKKVRNFLSEAMWADVEKRAKTIASQSQLNESMETLASQFNAAYLGYDEGLLTNDKVLASALWRRFFGKNCEDPRKIESLVSFIRKQIYLLDQLSTEDIFDKQKLIILKLSF